MDINTSVVGNIVVISLDGNFDGQTAEHVQEQLMSYITPNSSIVIDMSKCPYVSSAGLRVLLMAAKQLSKINGTGVFVGLSEEIRDVMEMTGFSNIFESFNSINDAIKAIRKE